MITHIKQIAKGSKTGIIAFRMYDNWRAGRRHKSGDVESTCGSTHIRLSLEQSLSYIHSVYVDYLTYAGLAPEAFRDKRVLEVGPGDNFGVALKLLAAGARQVVCLDKFHSTCDAEQQWRIYRALRDELSGESRRRFDDAISLDDGLAINRDRLQYVYGVGIEDASERFDAWSFDFIISRAVIQYVYRIDEAIAVMDRLLAPGGSMMHKIDLTDHRMFSDQGLHPLTFLTIPEPIYRRMAADSGKPNRKTAGYYRRKMDDLGYDAKILVSAVIGRGDLLPHKERIELNTDYSEAAAALIDAIRPNLTGEYRDLPSEELLTSGIFLIANKRESPRGVANA